MRVIIQRVSEASVTIRGEVKSSIGIGYLLLLGVGEADSEADADWLVNKIVNLRVFEDEHGKMNKSIEEISGSVLVISQFTLFAKTKKGNRPSYIKAAKPDLAIPLYEYFVKKMEVRLGHSVGTGKFGADMKVALVNDGPVTISIDTKNKE